MIHLRSPSEIEAIAKAGAIIARLFKVLEPRVKPGVTTQMLDLVVDDYVLSHEGATPAFKGLYGFPGSACISINEEVVHGIPSRERTLVEGDVVSIDIGVKLKGWCADSSFTFPVGEVSPEVAQLLAVTRTSLDAAIDAARPGNHVGDIGAAVMDAVEGSGLFIIRDLVGHGVGRDVHEEPQVPNIGKPGYGPVLKPGMVLALEPMLGLGTDKIQTLDDKWTVVTEDRRPSAHYEHTVAVTDEGPQILTWGNFWAPEAVADEASVGTTIG
ncbi:MAG: type I methionyl aminopeptidase [Gemmatimonadetes bacterium]|nr:type I methionyl aminopeptidase [Gemmatimonadota bacterium]